MLISFFLMIIISTSLKGWTHDEIVAGSVAEVEWKSTPETLQATLRATVSEAATLCNYPIARNVLCDVASCGRALTVREQTSPRFHVEAWLPFRNREMDYLNFSI